MFMLLPLVFVSARYNIGDVVADFTLTECNGGTFRLFDYNAAVNGGQAYVVMINFSEPWCGPCQSEAAQLEQIYQDYGPDHFIIVTIGSDWGQSGAMSCQLWIAQFGLTFPVLTDNINLYGAYGDGYVPYNVILDQDMTVRYSTSGFNQTAVRNQIVYWLSQISTDNDGDGIANDQDNCPDDYNPDQSDIDGDGIGDVCDPCPNSPQPGDVNGDGSILVNDIVRLVSIILGTGDPATECEWEGGDVNNDTRINVADIVWIVYTILHSGEKIDFSATPLPLMIDFPEEIAVKR